MLVKDLIELLEKHDENSSAVIEMNGGVVYIKDIKTGLGCFDNPQLIIVPGECTQLKKCTVVNCDAIPLPGLLASVHPLCGSCHERWVAMTDLPVVGYNEFIRIPIEKEKREY